MKTISMYSNNKKHFLNLLNFYKQLKRKLKITPILYGSLAYFIYTKDNKIKIHDLDFLIRENTFNKIIPILKKHNIKYNYSKEYHTLQVLKNNLKIEFDSIDFWQRNLSMKSNNIKINNTSLKVINLKSLTNIYKKASKVSKDNPKGNRKKYLKLKIIKDESFF